MYVKERMLKKKGAFISSRAAGQKIHFDRQAVVTRTTSLQPPASVIPRSTAIVCFVRLLDGHAAPGIALKAFSHH